MKHYYFEQHGQSGRKDRQFRTDAEARLVGIEIAEVAAGREHSAGTLDTAQRVVIRDERGRSLVSVRYCDFFATFQ